MRFKTKNVSVPNLIWGQGLQVNNYGYYHWPEFPGITSWDNVMAIVPVHKGDQTYPIAAEAIDCSRGWENWCTHVKCETPLFLYSGRTRYACVESWYTWNSNSRNTVEQSEGQWRYNSDYVVHARTWIHERYGVNHWQVRLLKFDGRNSTLATSWYSYDVPYHPLVENECFAAQIPEATGWYRVGGAIPLSYRKPMTEITDWFYFNENCVADYKPTGHVDFIGRGNQRPKNEMDILMKNHPDLADAMARAYLDALQNIGIMSENMLQNVGEAYGLAAALAKYLASGLANPKTLSDIGDDFINWLYKETNFSNCKEFVKRIANLWLTWRYAYTTTKLDVTEAVDGLLQKKYADTRDVYLYGQYSFNVGFDVRVKCRIIARNKELNDGMKNILDLFRGGLVPTPYVLWDAIPFSFMADWVAPIGDYLDMLSKQQFLNDTFYDIKGVCFSVQYKRFIPEWGTIDCYTRWPSMPISIYDNYLFDPHAEASRRTKVKRTLDTISLGIGYLK